ncbi:MAG: hypothetical protein ACKOYJ_05650 [Planctomycetia bacterium]
MIRSVVGMWGIVVIAGLLASGGPARAADPAAPSIESLPAYLASWDLGRSDWTALAGPGGWNESKQSLVFRLMARVARIPADRAVRWEADAPDVSGSLPDAAGDGFVRIRGRAILVAPCHLSGDDAAVAGRPSLDLVRVATGAGGLVDVIVESAPAAWPQWTAIDEPVSVVGLPLGTGAGPVPEGEGHAWPAEPHGLLMLGSRLSWYPATVLGGLGMDYATFDTVADGKPLVAGDTEAFFGLLAAVGKASPGAIAAAAGPQADIIPIIDPSERWFESHRGEPVTIEGVARRATRIAIDDPERRRQVGADHYWELYVFVPTQPIRVNTRVQDDFPVVCCVRSLPEAMPTGERIGERVRVSGFALKRYAYSLPRVRVRSSQGDEELPAGRRETPLFIGETANWLPAPSSRSFAGDLGWVLLGIAAVVGLVLVAAAWSFNRGSRRAAAAAKRRLPDRIELPPG